MPLYVIMVTPSSAQNSALLGSSGSNNIDWASLIGVNYRWGALHANGNAPAPSVSLPEMKTNGWNLIRVPIGWDTELNNPSAFDAALSTLASQADQDGIYVIYDFHAINANGWPSSLVSQYGVDGLYTAWWANQVTYNGQNGWQAQFDDLWKNVISTVDSHPSTLGYEIMNEPPSMGESELPYNQFVYNNIRMLSAKTVIFGAPFSTPGGGPTFGTSPAQAVKPSGTNIVMDVHDYDDTSGVLTHIQQWQQVTGLAGIVMGEFGARSASSQSAAQSYLQTYYSAFKQTGIASTYWAWECGASTTATGNNFLILLDNSCNQWWIDNAIVQTQNQVYGGGSTTTTSTSSTQSKMSSTSTSITSTTSSMSSTTIYSSSSSTSQSSSSTIFPEVQTSTSSFSQNYTQPRTNSDTTTITFTTSPSLGNEALAPSPSSSSLANGTAITYSFACYEIALVGGLPLISKTVSKGRKSYSETSHGWRW